MGQGRGGRARVGCVGLGAAGPAPADSQGARLCRAGRSTTAPTPQSLPFPTAARAPPRTACARSALRLRPFRPSRAQSHQFPRGCRSASTCSPCGTASRHRPRQHPRPGAESCSTSRWLAPPPPRAPSRRSDRVSSRAWQLA